MGSASSAGGSSGAPGGPPAASRTSKVRGSGAALLTGGATVLLPAVTGCAALTAAAGADRAAVEVAGEDAVRARGTKAGRLTAAVAAVRAPAGAACARPWAARESMAGRWINGGRSERRGRRCGGDRPAQRPPPASAAASGAWRVDCQTLAGTLCTPSRAESRRGFQADRRSSPPSSSRATLRPLAALGWTQARTTLAMPLKAADISRVRNKVVRSQLNEKRKKDQRQAKLKKRIARKEAEARGETVERRASLLPLALVGPPRVDVARCRPALGAPPSLTLSPTCASRRDSAHHRKHPRVARRRRRRVCRPAHPPRPRLGQRRHGRCHRRHGLALQPLPARPRPPRALDLGPPAPRAQGPHHDEPGKAPRALHAPVPRGLPGPPRRQDPRRRRPAPQPQVRAEPRRAVGAETRVRRDRRCRRGPRQAECVTLSLYCSVLEPSFAP